MNLNLWLLYSNLCLKKLENSFCSPFTFRPASSLWPALPFLGTGPLHLAFRPKLAHPCPSPFLLSPARTASAASPHYIATPYGIVRRPPATRGRWTEALSRCLQITHWNGAWPTPLPLLFNFETEVFQAALTAGRLPPLTPRLIVRDPIKGTPSTAAPYRTRLVLQLHSILLLACCPQKDSLPPLHHRH
jgi:hypothetical protein